MTLDNLENLTILRALPEHFEDIANIYNEYILQGTSTMEEGLWDANKFKKMVMTFSDREAIWILVKDQKTIGFSIIKKYSEREGYKFTCETSTYLTSSEIGKGNGTYFKKRVIEYCKELGYHHIVAKIFSTNQASLNYNLKLGYEIVGLQKEIGYRNGNWLDVIIMQYLIK